MITFIGMCMYCRDEYPKLWDAGDKRNRRIVVSYWLSDYVAPYIEGGKSPVIV